MATQLLTAPTSADAEVDTEIVCFPHLENTAISITLAAYVLLGVSSIFCFIFGVEVFGFMIGQVPIATVLFHLAITIRQSYVPEDRIGALFLLGKPVRNNITGGFYFFPALILQIRLFSFNVIQRQFPADKPEDIFKGGDKDPVPPGQVRGIRIQTGDPDPGDIKEEHDPLKRSAIHVFVEIYARFQIIDAMKVAIRMGSEEEIERQIRDTLESELVSVAAKRSPQRFRNETKEMGDQIEEVLKKRVKPWGVTVFNAGITRPDFGVGVGTAQNNNATAGSTRLAGFVQADIEGQKVYKLISGKAKGTAELAEAIQKDGGSQAIASQGIADLARGGKLVALGDTGLTGVATAVSTVLTALNENKDSKKEESSDEAGGSN